MMKQIDPFRRWYCLLSVIVLVAMAPAGVWSADKPAGPIATAKDLGLAFVEVAKKVNPSVVHIRAEKTVTFSPGEGREDFFKGTPFEEFFKRGGPSTKQRQVGEGSGIIVDATGYILTNYHVVGGADKLTVHLHDGKQLTGTVRGTDPKTDLAVVHVEAKGLPVPVLGDSDKLQVGEWAIAIGAPFGLEETVTVGVISAKGRSGLGTGTYEEYLQTDASINPGNSGGPLVNIDGEVIGINAMIVQPGQGIGFAIPINLAKTIMVQLINEGKVVRPWVGMGLQDLTPELMTAFNLKEKEGALISQVFPESPAEKVGLKVGDLILELDGKKIKNSREVVREVLKRQVGQKIQLVVLREGKRTELSVTPMQMPAELTEQKGGQPPKEWFGLKVVPVTPDAAKQSGLPKPEGVVIEGVESGSAAQQAGLRKGDIILEINRQKIKDEKDYRNAMEKLKPEQSVLLLINRGGSTFFTTLTEVK